MTWHTAIGIDYISYPRMFVQKDGGILYMKISHLIQVILEAVDGEIILDESSVDCHVENFLIS